MSDTTPPKISDDELKLPTGSIIQKASTSPLEKSKLAPLIIGILLTCLLLILGGMYLWQKMLTETAIVPSTSTRPSAEQNQEPESTTARAQTDTLSTLSTSDELNMIESDIMSTQLNTIDLELQAITNELDNAPRAE